MKNKKETIANPLVVLREEFDDWAILFDPDTGHACGLNPTGVSLWKLLDGEHSIDALLQEIRAHVDNVPQDASDHIKAFVDELVAQGLAGFDSTGFDTADRPERVSSPPPGEVTKVNPCRYEPPNLIDFSGGRVAYGAGECGSGSHAATTCGVGLSPGGGCFGGTSAALSCTAMGNSAVSSCNACGTNTGGVCYAGSSGDPCYCSNGPAV